MSSTERASKLPSPTPCSFEPISEFSFRLRCRFLASSSQLSGQYSDIAEGKPVTLSMAIDSIQALQRQLSDVEKKASTSGRMGGEGRGGKGREGEGVFNINKGGIPPSPLSHTSLFTFHRQAAKALLMLILHISYFSA